MYIYIYIYIYIYTHTYTYLSIYLSIELPRTPPPLGAQSIRVSGRWARPGATSAPAAEQGRLASLADGTDRLSAGGRSAAPAASAARCVRCGANQSHDTVPMNTATIRHFALPLNPIP